MGVHEHLSMNASTSTTTRVILPAATRPRSSEADTAKIRRRPSILSRRASAVTLEPTAVGARWSSCTRMPTVVRPSGTCPRTAWREACSHSATRRGVLRTGTSPVCMATAVSSWVTSRTTLAAKPSWRGTRVQYGDTRPAGENLGIPARPLPSRSPPPSRPSTEREVAVLDDATIQRTLAAALRTGGDFAEVFVEDKRSTSATLDDGRVEEMSSGRDRGAGIRVVVGDSTGFAHTADLTDAGRRAAAEAAAAAARSGGGGGRTGAVTPGPAPSPAHAGDLPDAGPRAAAEAAAAAARSGGEGVRTVSLTPAQAPRPHEVAVLPETVAKGDKVDLLRRANEAARAEGGSIRQVRARYGDSRRRILVANSDGLLAEDDQVRTLFVVSTVAFGDTGMQTGY